MRALITGGADYIGSHTAKRLTSSRCSICFQVAKVLPSIWAVDGAFQSARPLLPLNASPAFRSMFGQLLGGQATHQSWAQIPHVWKSF